MGLGKLHISSSHQKKRLAVESRHHGRPDDSHMFVIKLPPNPYYYTNNGPVPAPNAIEDVGKKVRTHRPDSSSHHRRLAALSASRKWEKIPLIGRVAQVNPSLKPMDLPILRLWSQYHTLICVHSAMTKVSYSTLFIPYDGPFQHHRMGSHNKKGDKGET